MNEDEREFGELLQHVARRIVRHSIRKVLRELASMTPAEQRWVLGYDLIETREEC